MAAVFVAGSIGGLTAVCGDGQTRTFDSASPLPAVPTPSTTLSKYLQPPIVALGDPALPMAPSPAASPVDLVTSFDKLEWDVGATLGLVITPVGRNEPALRLGNWWAAGPAWSTIKVPLAIAALRNQGSSSSLIKATITQSDNAAAEQLWADLGDPVPAAEAVEDVLLMTGDPTAVESERVRPGYSASGQTQWPLVGQANFLSSAVCDTSTAPVFELMGQIAADQRWGLGVLPGTRFKGGWGPSPDGAYLVRQIGIVATPSGRAAIAIAALPVSGSFDDGASALSAVAEWLGQHVRDLPGGQCG